MTGDKSLFKFLKEKVGDYVTFGDGSHAQVLGKRTVEIPGLPLLKDVLYIKGLKMNLLSIIQICDEDFLVQFSKKGCIIIDEEGIQVLEGNRTTDNCYRVVPTTPISCRSACVDMLKLWHHRLGHANFKQVAKVSKLEAVEGLPKFGNKVWKGGEDYLRCMPNGKVNKGKSSQGECDCYLTLFKASSH